MPTLPDPTDPARSPGTSRAGQPMEGPRRRRRYAVTLSCFLAVLLAACEEAPIVEPEPDSPSLFGIVRITNSEVLLEGVRVWVEGVDEDRTTPNGGYALEGFELGIVTVLAELDGHEQYSRRVRIDPGGNVHDIFLVPLTRPAAR